MSNTLPSIRNFFDTYLGYDTVLRHVEKAINSGGTAMAGNSYPPINVMKNRDDNSYLIEIALAGFKKNEIGVEHSKKNHILRVFSKLNEEGMTMTGTTPYDVIRQRIAKRTFSTAFTVADDLQVDSVKFEDGLLSIRLVSIVEEDDIRAIDIE